MARNRNIAGPIERFLAKVDFDGPWFREDRCWMWTASTNGVGYGKLSVDGRLIYAHRFSFILHVGPIPTTMEIDHLCRNHRCVNPSHLEAVPHRTNDLRGGSPVAINATKTHCAAGHELEGDNVMRRKNGNRRCRRCNYEWQRQRRLAKNQHRATARS